MSCHKLASHHCAGLDSVLACGLLLTTIGKFSQLTEESVTLVGDKLVCKLRHILAMVWHYQGWREKGFPRQASAEYMYPEAYVS